VVTRNRPLFRGLLAGCEYGGGLLASDLGVIDLSQRRPIVLKLADARTSAARRFAADTSAIGAAGSPDVKHLVVRVLTDTDYLDSTDQSQRSCDVQHGTRFFSIELSCVSTAVSSCEPALAVARNMRTDIAASLDANSTTVGWQKHDYSNNPVCIQ
jgi:hypothetical protein